MLLSESFSNDFGQLSQAWIWDVAVPSQLSAHGFKPDPCGTAAAPALPPDKSPDYFFFPTKPPVPKGFQCSPFPLEEPLVDADTANSPLLGNFLVTPSCDQHFCSGCIWSGQRWRDRESDGNVCPANSSLPPAGEERGEGEGEGNPGWRIIGSQNGLGWKGP